MAYKWKRLPDDEYQAIQMAKAYNMNVSRARKILEDAHSTRIMDYMRRYRALVEARSKKDRCK